MQNTNHISCGHVLIINLKAHETKIMKTLRWKPDKLFTTSKGVNEECSSTLWSKQLQCKMPHNEIRFQGRRIGRDERMKIVITWKQVTDYRKIYSPNTHTLTPLIQYVGPIWLWFHSNYLPPLCNIPWAEKEDWSLFCLGKDQGFDAQSLQSLTF